MVSTKLEMCLEIWNPWVSKPVSAPDLCLLMERGPSIVSSKQFTSATIYLISLQWAKYLLEKKNFNLIFNGQNRMQNWTQRLSGIAIAYTITEATKIVVGSHNFREMQNVSMSNQGY